MKKLIIRLLSIILLLYGVGLVCQLYATEPGERELPPAELDKDKYRALEPTTQAPTDLRGGICPGCGGSRPPTIPTRTYESEPEAEAPVKPEEEKTRIAAEARQSLQGIKAQWTALQKDQAEADRLAKEIESEKQFYRDRGGRIFGQAAVALTNKENRLNQLQTKIDQERAKLGEDRKVFNRNFGIPYFDPIEDDFSNLGEVGRTID
ncbi:MAG: hypothetical protein PHW74_11360 [Desulfobacca sp.]|nr:hypothetical protein [Desulfobacca sp.]